MWKEFTLFVLMLMLRVPSGGLGGGRCGERSSNKLKKYDAADENSLTTNANGLINFWIDWHADFYPTPTVCLGKAKFHFF